MKFSFFSIAVLLLMGCQSMNKILKNPDPQYKLRMAEQFYAKKKYVQAQQIYEDIMPFFRGQPEFEDIFYKYAYTAYNQKDYMNAENLFKNYLEVYPNGARSEEIDYMRSYTFFKQSPKAELDQTATLKAIGMFQTFINTHPGSGRNKDATEIIDKLRQKLEVKDRKAAQLYYDIGQFRAAAVAFNTMLNQYADTDNADQYKLMAIKSYFRFAELSIEEKKAERFEKVLEEANDFMDRFPASPLSKEVQQFVTQSQNNLKIYTNEPAKTTT
ncbi:MAG TPA: outer membrane protein assembly factor BamD [Flavisolibacter sp.]|jgi:outer membrane protein assembly factor BamD|nr:outer membrane protein assembly factor BamD [Flavisolibacter sp.]